MLSSELRNQVAEFVNSRISIYELEQWMAPHLPYFLSASDSENADVVSAIELVLAEIDSELMSIDEARSYLRDVLREYNTVFFQFGDRTSGNETSSAADYTSTVVVPQPTTTRLYLTRNGMAVSSSASR